MDCARRRRRRRRQTPPSAASPIGKPWPWLRCYTYLDLYDIRLKDNARNNYDKNCLCLLIESNLNKSLKIVSHIFWSIALTGPILVSLLVTAAVTVGPLLPPILLLLLVGAAIRAASRFALIVTWRSYE